MNIPESHVYTKPMTPKFGVSTYFFGYRTYHYLLRSKTCSVSKKVST